MVLECVAIKVDRESGKTQYWLSLFRTKWVRPKVSNKFPGKRSVSLAVVFYSFLATTHLSYSGSYFSQCAVIPGSVRRIDKKKNNALKKATAVEGKVNVSIICTSTLSDQGIYQAFQKMLPVILKEGLKANVDKV